MRITAWISCFAFSLALALIACGASHQAASGPTDPASSQAQDQQKEMGQQPAGSAASTPLTPQSSHSRPKASVMAGKVVETMDSGGYTYALVDSGNEKAWVAAPPIALKVGDRVRVVGPMVMNNYTSKTLKRTFELIYFATALAPDDPNKPESTMSPAMPANNRTVAPPVKITGITKLQGGYTVAELFSLKKQLEGKEVRLRGQVVKANRNIMDKNWFHLQDGTGKEKENDLTISSQDSAEKGDLVVVTGILAVDKDLGMGYEYPLILEQAKITVEKSIKAVN